MPTFTVAANLDEEVFKRVLYGISCRNYEQAAGLIPGPKGLSELDLVAVFLDGKSFAADQMVIAVGVDLEGCKHILGFVQTATENERTLTQFLVAPNKKTGRQTSRVWRPDRMKTEKRRGLFKQ